MSVNEAIKQKYELKPNTCKVCKKNILYERRNLKYCSDECKKSIFDKVERVTNIEKNCLNCDTKIICKDNTKERFERTKCCSKQCLYEWMRKTSPDKKEREIRICKFCNKNYEQIKDSNRKKVYCSNECFRKGHKGSFKLSEEHKKRISETRLRDWAEGEVYKDQTNFFCKWYNFTKNNGEVIKVQGTWELKYAEWLEKNNINYICHKGCIYYKDENGKDRVYLPDFYLIDTDEYIDIKNLYIFNLHKNKFDNIKKSNPDIKIKLLFKEDLTKLGIIL